MISAQVTTPVGSLILHSDGTQLTSIDWGRECDEQSDAVIERAKDELAAYFDGTLVRFTTPMRIPGSGFKSRFLQALIDIPYGHTRTYGDLAGMLGVSAQAIGQACGANQIPIMIPCHRVLAANGLGGYSGAHGIETKVALLRHEGAASLLI